MSNYYKIFTAKAPVNIAVIKYWGKSDEALKIPINDSLSGTLNIDEMCATTTAEISSSFKDDELWLNGQRITLDQDSSVKILLDEFRRLTKLDNTIRDYKVHIASQNNFPTAAGLASSAAGYACLAFVLGHIYGITNRTELSKLARRGSGSACRSLFGGFVQWTMGYDHDSSKSLQIVDHKHWPEMRIIICVVNDKQKDVSSSAGMLRSVKTSPLLLHRAKSIVSDRIKKITDAILRKDFDTFANITMCDSNQFHAICLDTYPPLFYLNETSKEIIKICSIINSIANKNLVAYTFDAGPNACIYILEDFLNEFIVLIKKLFPIIQDDGSEKELEVKGAIYQELDLPVEIFSKLVDSGVKIRPNCLNYLINTSIGDGPKLVEEKIICGKMTA